MTKSATAPFMRENVALAPFTTLGVGGPARFWAEASHEDHVLEALGFASVKGCPVFVLGAGSNVLVSDSGFPGLVLHIALRGIFPEKSGRSDVVTVAAGEDWDPFVQHCIDHGLAGIECLSGIPGTAGATPVQNVGAYGEEVAEVIVSVRALDRENSEIIEFSNAACGFDYRTSIFNTTQKDRYIILGVTFALRAGGEPQLRYDDLRRLFGSGPGPSLAEVRDAVLAVRASKAMLLKQGDPDCRSAGSFFKNPFLEGNEALRAEEMARRQGRLADGEPIPRLKAPPGKIKIPAAWLIERAGFHKGYTRGSVGLSSKHTLALINRGGASSRDIVELMREIQDGVRETFGIDLITEPVFLGF